MGGTLKIKPKLINQSITQSSADTQILLVASGRQGSLRVGESVPSLQWITEYGFQGGYTVPQVVWQEVGSFLVVEPVIIGDGPMIRVRLTPELRGIVDGKSCQTRFASVSTEVMVQDGESFQIGGSGKTAEFYSRFLVGTARNGMMQNLNIRMIPRIMTSSGFSPR
jgi:hypothetical protein